MIKINIIEFDVYLLVRCLRLRSLIMGLMIGVVGGVWGYQLGVYTFIFDD